MSKNWVEQHLEALSWKTFSSLERPDVSIGRAQVIKRKITAKHSFPGFKNQAAVNSKITL